MAYRAKNVSFASEDMAGASSVAGEIDFDIDFFGSLRSQVWVHEDGTITFSNNNPGSNNVDFTRTLAGQSVPTYPVIAALWDDLKLANLGALQGEVLKKSFDVGMANERLAVQWTNFTYVDDNNTPDPITFQAVLYADGRIRFNYIDLDSFPENDNDQTVNEVGGISATVGIWGGAASTLTVAAGKFVPGLHSIDGSDFQFLTTSSFETRVDSNDSYIRIAWDTGGASWDIGVIDEYAPDVNPQTSLPYGVYSPEANALRDAFIESLGNQIRRAAARGEVFRDDRVLLALNLGQATGDEDAGAAGLFRADNGAYTDDGGAATVLVDDSNGNAIDITKTNSVPGTMAPNTELSSFEAENLSDVFATARGGTGATQDVSLVIDTLDIGGVPTPLQDGAYIVELFFAEYGSTGEERRVFDVVLEGATVLNDYEIELDRAQINTNFGAHEHDSIPTGIRNGIVKRFEIDVTGEQLEIVLQNENSSTFNPLLSAVRILATDASERPPTILDVALYGSGWTGADSVLFSERVPSRWQLRPIATAGVDTIQIQFSEDVLLDGSELELRSTQRLSGGDSENLVLDAGDFTFYYDSSWHAGTWTFEDALPDGKFAIHLSAEQTGGVTDVAGNALDGEWDNDMIAHAGTPDDFTDDGMERIFAVGNGTAGSTDSNKDGTQEFRLHFALLAYDYSGDGVVNGADVLEYQQQYTSGPAGEPLADGNGDGVVDGLDDPYVHSPEYGAKLPMLFAGGDFNDDEMVDVQDLIMWEENFGPASEFDGAGFLAWQRAYGEESVWYFPPPMMMPENLPLIANPLAPKVVDLIISGSASLHSPYSFDGAGADGTGAQLTTVPVGGADTITIVFSDAVNVSADCLLVFGLRTATLPVVAEFSYDVATNAATWRFEGWALGDQYLLSLADTITNISGVRLDGEWVNPTSVSATNSSGLINSFPSGDGFVGGRFNFVMTLLTGDANLDNVVDSADMLILSENVNVPDRLFIHGDFTGDGWATLSEDGFPAAAIWGLDLQALNILADLDDDKDVDGDDLDIISDNLGMTGASWADGDLDGDGEITEEDCYVAFALCGLELDLAS